MRGEDTIRDHINQTSRELKALEQKKAELREELGGLLAEARSHPCLTLEEGRRIAGVSRQTANRLLSAVRDAEKAGAEREWAHKVSIER